MAFEDVEAVADEFWTPENVNDSIEGNVYKIVKDQWGNDRIVLDLGDDENGEIITTTLPPHAHLRRFIPKLSIGDYVRVTLSKLIEPTKEQLEDDPTRKPTRIYKVQKDPEQKIDYDIEE